MVNHGDYRMTFKLLPKLYECNRKTSESDFTKNAAGFNIFDTTSVFLNIDFMSQ